MPQNSYDKHALFFKHINEIYTIKQKISSWNGWNILKDLYTIFGYIAYFQLLEYKSFTYSYLVADPDTKEAILIDPVIETVPRDSKIVKDLGLNLKYASKPTFKSIKTIQSLEQLYYTTV